MFKRCEVGAYEKKIKYVITTLMSFLFIFPVAAETQYVNCGKIKHIPSKILQLSNTVISILQIAVPVILIIMGSVDFVKAIINSKTKILKDKRQIGYYYHILEI